MAGRPPIYDSADERPISVSLRIPKALYDEAQQYAKQRRMTLTELLLDGLKMRLATPTDPRELFLSDNSNTVMQQLRDELKDALLDELRKDVQTLLGSTIQAGLTQTALPSPTYDTHPARNNIPSDSSNTVLQETHLSVAPHIAAIAQVAAEHPTLSLAQLATLLYERGIYRAKDRATGAETVVNRGTLKVWLDKARAAGLLSPPAPVCRREQTAGA
jgi:hypothetical protein